MNGNASNADPPSHRLPPLATSRDAYFRTASLRHRMERVRGLVQAIRAERDLARAASLLDEARTVFVVLRADFEDNPSNARPELAPLVHVTREMIVGIADTLDDLAISVGELGVVRS